MKIELITGRVIEVVETLESFEYLILRAVNGDYLFITVNYKDTVICLEDGGHFKEVVKPIRINLSQIVS